MQSKPNKVGKKLQRHLGFDFSENISETPGASGDFASELATIGCVFVFFFHF